MNWGATIGGVAGAGLGTFFGGPVGAAVGMGAGSAIGGWVGEKIGGAPAEDPYQKQLRLAAMGQGGPSSAERAAGAVANRGVAAQYALGASAHGMAPAARLHASTIGAAKVTGDAAAQAAIIRAQEQERARAALLAVQNQQMQKDQSEQAYWGALLGGAAQGFMAQKTGAPAAPAPQYAKSASGGVPQAIDRENPRY